MHGFVEWKKTIYHAIKNQAVYVTSFNPFKFLSLRNGVFPITPSFPWFTKCLSFEIHKKVILAGEKHIGKSTKRNIKTDLKSNIFIEKLKVSSFIFFFVRGGGCGLHYSQICDFLTAFSWLLSNTEDLSRFVTPKICFTSRY